MIQTSASSRKPLFNYQLPQHQGTVIGNEIDNAIDNGNAKRKIKFTLFIRVIHSRQIKQTDDPIEFISFGGDTSVSESIRRFYPKRIIMTNNDVTNDGAHC